MQNSQFFEENRKKLSNSVENHFIILAANSMLQSSADVAYSFRQDSNFWYLTGIDEPDLVLIIDTEKGEPTLLLPEQNEYQKEWEGENKESELRRLSGITKFDSIGSLKKRLQNARRRKLKIGYQKPLEEIVQPFGFYSNPARRKLETVVKKVVTEPQDIRTHIAKLRQVKQTEEVEAIQTAVNATAVTLKKVKQRIDSFETEKDLERAISAGFFANGTDGHAYEPIVASGKNAAIIHYQKNNAAINKNELLLLDVGALYNKYAADISRTWAVGRPSQRHVDVFSAVLATHNQALALLKPGMTIREFHNKVEVIAAKENKKIGVHVERYPHLISHYLGLDVHDAGDYDAPLEDGVVLTVEPGIYLAREGIGVRIEDNVLITKNGIHILSESIPKEL